MSQLYRRLGSRVTVIERATRVAEHEDEDVALALQKILEGEGITFRAPCHRWTEADGGTP